MRSRICLIVGVPLLAFALAVPASADFVINDDLIVDGSACIGFDCVNGETFGFDTIKLKENNVRIKFDDTSNSASFPNNDWQLLVNDSANGGLNRFSVEDVTGGRIPFTIEKAAPTNSLYVEDSGEIGFGTNNPVCELHVVDGDSPCLRLQQDGSSGFTPQTWDLAGNETNLFIRDATNGSKLPFRIRPNTPGNALYLESDNGGEIGMGTASPTASLHILRTNGTAQVLVEEASTTEGGRTLLSLKNNGPVIYSFIDTSADGDEWRVQTQPSNLRIRNNTDDVNFAFQTNGDLSIPGNFISNGMTLNVPDYVFEDDYKLMPLDELESFIAERRHLPNVPSAKEVKSSGLNMTVMQMKLLEKVEELTLYNLQQEKKIRELQARLDKMDNKSEK